MSHAELTQWLIDVTRGPLKEAFQKHPDAVIAASPLESSLQQALRTHDMGTLWLAGAHPMALLYFSRLCGWDNERYYRCITQAQPGTVAPTAVVAHALPSPQQTHQ